jgi:hypothetical protein
VQAYLDVILTANQKNATEAMEMKKEKCTLDQIFIDSGWAALWEERGAHEKACEDARNFRSLGVSDEIIAQATGLALEEIAGL